MKNQGDLSGYYKKSPDKDYFKIANAEVYINDTLWTIDPENLVVIDTMGAWFKNLNITGGESQMSFSGKIPRRDGDSLKVSFNNWNLSNFDMVTKLWRFELDGIINGNFQYDIVDESPVISSNIIIDHLAMNKEYLGKAELINTWNNSNKSISIKTNVTREGASGSGEVISINGVYFPFNDEQSFDLDILFNRLKIGVIEPFFVDFISQLEGVAEGELKLTGSAEKPVLTGFVDMHRTQLLINYLNTKYSFSNVINFKKDRISFDELVIYDTLGNFASVDGYLYHEYFKNTALNVKISTDKLLAFNTTRKMNELYYGQGLVAGNIKISGNTMDISLDMDLTTLEGTDVKLPMDYSLEISDKDYIIFLSHTDTLYQEEDIIEPFLDADITPEEIRERIKSYDFVHFAGHAEYASQTDHEGPEQSGWKLSDGNFSVQDIDKMASSSAMPSFVFSNACQSARTGEWDWKGTPGEGSFGLANAFLRAGVKHYVGTFWEIMDEPSSHFAHEFYERMCSGMSMGEAVKQARCNLIEKYGPDTCWASYILYGDPRVSYFSPDEQFEQTPASESAMIRSSSTRGTLFNYALNTTRLREMRNWLVAILLVIFLGIGIVWGNYVLKRLSANEQIRIQELLIEQAEKKQKRTEALFRELTEITGSDPQTQNAGGMRTLAMVFDSQISLSNQKTENLVAFAIQSEMIEHSRFKILERKSFDTILRELIWEKPEQLSLLMPEVLLLLEVYDKDESPLVLMRLVDKKTGVVVANLFESLKKGLPVFEQKKQLSENLLKKLEDHYPLHGTILDIKGREATLNIGHDAGVRPGQRFRARNTDVVLEVTVVNSDTCIARVEKDGMELKKGWQVEAIFSL